MRRIKILVVAILAVMSLLVNITEVRAGQQCSGTFTCCREIVDVCTPTGCRVGFDDPCSCSSGCAPGQTQTNECNLYTDENCSIYFPTSCAGLYSGTCTAAPTSTPVPTATTTVAPTGTTTPPPASCVSDCFTDIANCGSVGYQGGIGSCATGICCRPMGGPLPPTCEELRLNVGVADQYLHVGEMRTMRVRLWFSPSDSSVAEIVHADQYDEPDNNLKKIAFNAALTKYGWSSDWLSSTTSPLQWYVQFWGKRPGTLNIGASAILTNGTTATCSNTSHEITVYRNTASIWGYIFDATTMDACPGTPRGLANVTVTMTNLSTGLTYTDQTNSRGFYIREDLPASATPTTYRISYDTSAYPELQNSPAKFYCQGGTDVELIWNQGGRRDFGLYLAKDPWWQVRGGDVYGESGLTTNIPEDCATGEGIEGCGSYTDGGTVYTPMVGGTDPGVAMYQSGSIGLGGGGVAPANAILSATGWSGKTKSPYDYDYAFYKSWIQRTVGLTTTVWDGAGKPSSSTTTAYASSGTLNWDQSLAAGEKIVILHNGDVNITGNVVVPEGAYLSIIASGSINIASAVTAVDGVYVAETINVQSTGSAASEQQFVGNGTFVGWTGVTLSRDLAAGNATRPAELFNFRPDFVINAPRIMKLAKYVWTEVKP